MPHRGSVRIVRLANFVTPSSGGLRTTLSALGEGYRAAGHDPVLVLPGDQDGQEETPAGLVVTVRGLQVPFLGGYRVMLDRRRVAKLLTSLAPDRIEVSDQITLRWVGRWAREHDVPAMMVAHESLRGLLGVAGLPIPLARWLADRLNRASIRAYDTILCTTDWAAADFRRVGARNVRIAGLGVDLTTFHPDRHDPVLRAVYAKPNQALLVHCGRLSAEKAPGRSVEALLRARAAGLDAVLVVAGDGPLRDRLIRHARGAPVEFVKFVPDRRALAALLASADVVIAPGPIETFGLAALEALACGTPVVVDSGSALPEVVGDAGVAADHLHEGVAEILARPEAERRVAARLRAEQFGWRAAVAGFLAAHDAPPAGQATAVADRRPAGTDRTAESAAATDRTAESAGATDRTAGSAGGER